MQTLWLPLACQPPCEHSIYLVMFSMLNTMQPYQCQSKHSRAAKRLRPIKARYLFHQSTSNGCQYSVVQVHSTGNSSCHSGDMRTMPIRSESNQIKHHKTKRSKMCKGPGQPVLLGPPKCKCNMKYDKIWWSMICARCPIRSARLSKFVRGHANMS